MRTRLLLVLLLAGCGTAELAKSDADAGSSATPPPWQAPGDDATPDETPVPDGSAPVGRVDGMVPSGPPALPADAAVPPGPDDGPTLPCEVSAILAGYCSGCHGAVPLFGAPMPLVTLADLQAPAPGQPGVSMYDRVLARMEDEQRPMPPPPNAVVDPADVAVFRAWVEGGAQPGAACESAEQPDAGLKPELPPPNPECDYVFELRAHGRGAANDDSPYMVPPLTDLYVNFSFQVPWMGEAQAIEFHPIVDDARVLHHYLLYTFPVGGGLADGTIVPGIGMHIGESMVAGWAPGGTPVVMPPDVGLQMPPGPTGRLSLEIHYHNETGEVVPDRSGVRACVTTRKREHAAAVSLLGTEALAIIPGTTRFTGICTPVFNVLLQEPIHIISSIPHLHRRGRHITTTIHRRGGGQDILLDTNFDFDNQIGYDTPAVLNPGDWLTTTCTYESTDFAIFGIRTQDEMCQNYVTTWPAGRLDTGGSLIFEAHACML